MAVAAVVPTFVHVNNGNRMGDDALASSPVPRSRPRYGNGGGSGGRLCASTTGTGQVMMHWHHHLSLAHPLDDNGDGSVSGGADAHVR